MGRRSIRITIAMATLAAQAASPMTAGVMAAAPAGATALRVGAAKVDITPTELPAPFKAVADRVFVRALVVDNGMRRAVIVIADVPTIQAGVAADLSRRIAATAHAAPETVLLGTSHTHNSVRVDPQTKGLFLPGSPKYVAQVVAATVEAVRQASDRLRPARMAFGYGEASVAANRNQWDPRQHRFIDGVDRTGTQPFDRRLGVAVFRTPEGKPIAFLLNYGIEPVVAMARGTDISGDATGAAAAYVEDHADGAVALFTVGAAGSPLFRSHVDPATGQADPRAMLTAMGTMLGEEALATARDAEPVDRVDIAGALETLTCPGKATVPLNLPNQCAYTSDSTLPPCVFHDQDAPPVDLSMGVLRLGTLALVHADANVTPALGIKLQHASPLAHTMIVARSYGPFHYVVDDPAYPLNTYEATASTARRGCAEQGFVGDALAMIDRAR